MNKYHLKIKTHPVPAISFLILLGLLWSSSACKFHKNKQGEGLPALYGEWQQMADKNSQDLISYTQRKYTFTCDSFYVALNTRSKANYYAPDCMQGNTYMEYAKGNYVCKGDTLIIFGTFTKSNFKQKISGCFRIGQYIEKFLIKNTAKDSLTLLNCEDNQQILHFYLTKTIHCTPKEL